MQHERMQRVVVAKRDPLLGGLGIGGPAGLGPGGLGPVWSQIDSAAQAVATAIAGTGKSNAGGGGGAAPATGGSSGSSGNSGGGSSSGGSGSSNSGSGSGGGSSSSSSNKNNNNNNNNNSGGSNRGSNAAGSNTGSGSNKSGSSPQATGDTANGAISDNANALAGTAAASAASAAASPQATSDPAPALAASGTSAPPAAQASDLTSFASVPTLATTAAGTTTEQPQQEQTSDPKVGAIVGPILAILVIAVAVILLFICRRRRRREQQQQQQQRTPSSFGDVSRQFDNGATSNPFATGPEMKTLSPTAVFGSSLYSAFQPQPPTTQTRLYSSNTSTKRDVDWLGVPPSYSHASPSSSRRPTVLSIHDAISAGELAYDDQDSENEHAGGGGGGGAYGGIQDGSVMIHAADADVHAATNAGIKNAFVLLSPTPQHTPAVADANTFNIVAGESRSEQHSLRSSSSDEQSFSGWTAASVPLRDGGVGSEILQQQQHTSRF